MEPLSPKDIQYTTPLQGGTLIINQRHGIYNRSGENIGSLTKEEESRIFKETEENLENMFNHLTQQEISQIDFLIIASDTKYKDGGQRSIETANIIMKVLEDKVEDGSLSITQILNYSREIRAAGKYIVRPEAKIREPQIFTQSPDFVAFLEEKYGINTQSFWQAFENDTESEKRKEMKAEGPNEIKERYKKFLSIIARYSSLYHRKSSGRRLIVFIVSHYDTLSPIFKEITNQDKTSYQGVDYTGGFSISISPEGNANTNVRGNQYPIKL